MRGCCHGSLLSWCIASVEVGPDGNCKHVKLCGAIAGTLDPLRNLTGLTELLLSTNSIGGMLIFVAVGMLVVVSDLWWLCVRV